MEYLENGDIVCENCHGKGVVGFGEFCFKCYGFGKLDWIENIVGRKANFSGVIVKNLTNRDIFIHDLGNGIKVPANNFTILTHYFTYETIQKSEDLFNLIMQGKLQPEVG